MVKSEVAGELQTVKSNTQSGVDKSCREKDSIVDKASQLLSVVLLLLSSY